MAKKKLLIAAVVVGMLAAFLLFLYANQIKQEKEELIGDQESVIKAARDIPAGTLLTRELTRAELVPVRFLPPNAILADSVDVYLGQPLAVNVEEGAMVLASDFSTVEVSRDLSNKVPSGERALAVPVDGITGVSGLLTPGDRVDVLGTFPVSDETQLVKDATGQKAVGYVTMTLLQNVTLLAVGTMLSNVNAEAPEKRHSYSSVTMSVTVDEAELLTIAQTRGKLMLLLRNRDDVEVATVTRRTLKEVLEDLEVIQREREKRIIKSKSCKQNPNQKKCKKDDGGIIVETGGGGR